MKKAYESDNGLPRSVTNVASLPSKGYLGATVYCEADQNLYVYTGSGYAAIGGGDGGATVAPSIEYVAGDGITISDGTGTNAGKKVVSALISEPVEYVAGNGVSITDGTGANSGKKVISSTVEVVESVEYVAGAGITITDGSGANSGKKVVAANIPELQETEYVAGDNITIADGTGANEGKKVVSATVPEQQEVVEYVAGENVTITDGTGSNAGKKVVSATVSGGTGTLDSSVARWYSTKYVRELPAAANDGTFFYVEEDDGVYLRALGSWRKLTFGN